MATTSFTSGLRLTNQPTGGNASTWGTITDDNMEFLDDAITGIVTVDLTGASSHTLTTGNGSTDEARHASLFTTGTPSSANSVIIPASEKIYAVRTAHTSILGDITFRTDTGTGVTLGTGEAAWIQCDGVSVFNLNPTVSALDPSNNLSDVADAVAAVSNLGLAYLGSANELDTTMQTSSGKLGVNLSAVQSNILEAVFPVGTLYSNRTDGTNPGTLFGLGVWASAGLGRVPVGVGTGVDANGVSVIFAAETCGGEYEHVMTTAELVIHRHSLAESTDQGGTDFGTESLLDPGTGRFTDFEGSSEAFNVQQPWFSVFQWVRTS